MKTLKYTSTLIAVADMEKSKQFYHIVLGLEVVSDFGDKACNKTYKTIHLLDEINENSVHFRRLERPLPRSDQSARTGGTK